MLLRYTLWLWMGMAFTRLSAMGVFELEGLVPDGHGGQSPTALVLAFPDSVGGVDPHAFLVAGASVSATTLFPGGRVTAVDALFLKGLREFSGGNPGKAAETWGGLRQRRMHAELRSSLKVDEALLLCLRGETDPAESVWTEEWRQGKPAAEPAWRNLLGLFLARHRFETANALLDQVLRGQPRNRAACLAKAALLRQIRPDSEWEEFLRNRSAPEDSLPDLQLAYGEFLVSRKRWAEAVPNLDRGLTASKRYGLGWFELAEAQYHLGYHVFALRCLENAFRSGYRESEFYELYARVLRGCCMGGDEEQSAGARKEAEHLLEEGLPKDLHRRAMAQLLYHVYCQNKKPEAAKELEKSLWFHFQGPSQGVPKFGDPAWKTVGLEAQTLSIHFGLYAFSWVRALSESDLYRAF